MKIDSFLPIPKIIKVWSFRLLIIFSILLFLFCVNVIAGLYIFGHQMDDSQDETLQHIVNSVLEIPYLKKDFVIDRPEYIKTLTPEEWMNVQCKILDVYKRSTIGISNEKTLTEEQKWHLECVTPNVVSKFATGKSVNGELCSNHFNCQVRNLAVNHYVFQHPEILWSIIKIAERPCDFIKTFDRKLEEEEYRPGDDEQRAMVHARSARRDLCNNGIFYTKSRKFVLITVQDIENKRIMDIIVRRQDID